MSKYRYIHFTKSDETRAAIWSCRNNRSGEELGTVKWYMPWQQYCYFPSVQAVYSAGCLRDIAAFIEKR